MKGYNEAFKDIPGTVVFDATQSRLGYHLNQFCMSLMKPENRAAFKADERGYLAKWPMSEEQRQAAGITQGVIRLAVGLEHVGDIQADLSRGLDNLQ